MKCGGTDWGSKVLIVKMGVEALDGMRSSEIQKCWMFGFGLNLKPANIWDQSRARPY